MSLAPSGMPWSLQQQHWLAALGYTVWVPVGVEPALDAPLPEDAVLETPAAQVRRSAPDFADRDLARPSEGTVSSVRAGESGGAAPAMPVRSRPVSRLPDRLHFALIRASGCNPNAPGAEQIFAQWPASSQLRGNPAAKRALWPHLRALRRPKAP